MTAQVLVNRGLGSPAAARAFLAAGRSDLLDPFLLKDMDRLVAALREAIGPGRRLMVYGDYDVDGVTGTTILVHTLRRLGAEVDYFIPNRFAQGYGLNAGALEQIRERGFDLVLSVDTGTTGVAEAERARELGITLLITDHHEPGPELPVVPALVNPKRPDCPYPFKGLSGVGVAFKLAQALCGPDSPIPWESVDVVALGTIADVVPLVEENRCLVKEGLQALGHTWRPGLRALMDIAGGMKDGVINTTQVAFALAPRINAMGRMNDASFCVELLLTEDPTRAQELAQRLDGENRARQATEAEIVEQALEQATQHFDPERDRIVVLAGEGWHQGVVGIVASRMVEAFYRPTILLSIDADGNAKGSARSIPGFHLHEALSQVADLMTKFGGHAMAAGMSLPAANIPEFRRRLGEVARQMLPEPPVPGLKVDAWVPPEALSLDLVSEFESLGPFGQGNPQPTLACGDLTCLEARPVGKDGSHLKLRVAPPGIGGPPLDAIGFGMAAANPTIGGRIDAAFVPEVNTWQGRDRLQLRLVDLGGDLNLARSVGGAAPVVDGAGWDPLTHLEAPAPGEAPALLLDVAQAQAAAGIEGEEPEFGVPEARRKAGLLALLAAHGPVLAVAASPWAAAALQAYLEGEAVTVAVWGQLPATGAYAAVALCHPPYTLGQLTGAAALVATGAPVHALWQEHDWDLARSTLGWPYPDREELVRLYKHLRTLCSGTRSTGADQLAAALPAVCREPAGPWNRMKAEAALQVFAEVGLAACKDGRWLLVPSTVKLDLEASARYRRGALGRQALQACQVWVAKSRRRPGVRAV